MKKALVMFGLAVVLMISAGGLSYSLDQRAEVVRQSELVWQIDGLDQAPPLLDDIPQALSLEGTLYIPLQLLKAVEDYTVDVDESQSLVRLQRRLVAQAAPQVVVREVIVERSPSPPVVVEPPMPETAPLPPVVAADWEQRAEAILATGDALVGTPHLYGAVPGQTANFDCSSFVQYVYQQHGITLFRSSAYQAMQGVEIAKEDLRKGDLVFFSSTRSGPGRIGHVAIYAGDGLLLHTFNERGVTYSPLTGVYWTNNYITARRVFLK